MMWLTIVLILGCLVMLVQSSLESIIVWLEHRNIVKTSSTEWFNNDILQLQRMTHEGLGLGRWTNCTGPRVIPVTEKGQLLGVLDCTDPKHPTLINPFAVSDETSSDQKVDIFGSQSTRDDPDVISSHSTQKEVQSHRHESTINIENKYTN